MQQRPDPRPLAEDPRVIAEAFGAGGHGCQNALQFREDLVLPAALAVMYGNGPKRGNGVTHTASQAKAELLQRSPECRDANVGAFDEPVEIDYGYREALHHAECLQIVMLPQRSTIEKREALTTV
jgi:hypothetical protein